MAQIDISNLQFAYDGSSRGGDLHVDQLSVEEGRFVALVGPSGSGKSTLLKIVAGLLTPTAGEVSVGGASVAGQPGHVAYMPQGLALLPWLSVRDNAVLGAEIGGVSRGEAYARAEALLPRFGLAGYENHWPSQLSGGMKQRLALLRTFLTPKQALLLDEPLGALDAMTRRDMQAWLQAVWREDGRTVVLVTHDIEEALLLADTVHVMSAAPARISASVDVDLDRPRDPGSVLTDAFISLKARLMAELGEAKTAG